MTTQAFSASTQEAEQVDLSEFEASLVYGVNSRTVRATQRNPVSKKQKEKKKHGGWSRSLILRDPIKNPGEGLETGSVFKSSPWLFFQRTRVRWGVQFPAPVSGSLQLSEAPVPGDLMPSSGLCWHCMYSRTCRQNTHT